jgi:hypothetical protein
VKNVSINLSPLVFFIGRLVYQKGPDLLVDAIPQVLKRRWDVQFIIAGKGDMRRELEERCRTLPVRFTGFISDEEYLQILNACDLVVIPSRNEPFGLVLTEAWSAERCVVATEVGGLSENIANFIDGIKVPVRADSLAWGISYIIEDPVRIRAMGIAGKRNPLRFNWKDISRMMERSTTHAHGKEKRQSRRRPDLGNDDIGQRNPFLSDYDIFFSDGNTIESTRRWAAIRLLRAEQAAPVFPSGRPMPARSA